jgi:hypothetical protein
MAIPAIGPDFRWCGGFPLTEGLAVLDVTEFVIDLTELVVMFELYEGLVEFLGWLPCRTASFNGLESILSGTMVLNQGNDT